MSTENKQLPITPERITQKEVVDSFKHSYPEYGADPDVIFGLECGWQAGQGDMQVEIQNLKDACVRKDALLLKASEADSETTSLLDEAMHMIRVMVDSGREDKERGCATCPICKNPVLDGHGDNCDIRYLYKDAANSKWYVEGSESSHISDQIKAELQTSGASALSPKTERELELEKALDVLAENAGGILYKLLDLGFHEAYTSLLRDVKSARALLDSTKAEVEK